MYKSKKILYCLTSILIGLNLVSCGASKQTPTPSQPQPTSVPPTISPTQPISQVVDVGPILYSAGSDIFLPYQSCIDLDKGKINDESKSACDFSAQTVENEAGRIYLQLNPLASSGFAFDSLFQEQPAIEQCRELAGYLSTSVVANPVENYICYRTSDARDGILYLRDWDIDHGMTITWQTYPGESDLSSTDETPYDAATFVADLTILDGSPFSPGQTFSKGWRLRNSGTTTWSTDYHLVFISGSQMNGPSEQALPIQVPPGDSVDIYVNLTAPDEPGEHTGHWMLKNVVGDSFGIGVGAGQSFYVNILVTDQ